MIHVAGLLSQPVVITIFSFHTVVIAIGVSVGLAEGLIDDTGLVLIPFEL